MSSHIKTAALFLATAALITGCTSAISAEDKAALAVLAEVAGPTSGVPSTASTERTECWLPSEHLIESDQPDSTQWKVLCRVHWISESGEKRYQDTTCIGDFADSPMLDHCYRWTFYGLMPVFNDYPSVAAVAKS